MTENGGNPTRTGEFQQWQYSVERVVEPCIFPAYFRGQQCVVCGRRCLEGIKQKHPTGVLVMGSFELDECHDLNAYAELEARLATFFENSVGLVNMGFRVLDCDMNFGAANEPRFRYSFQGRTIVDMFEAVA